MMAYVAIRLAKITLFIIKLYLTQATFGQIAKS